MPYDPQLPPDGAGTASTGLWPDPLACCWSPPAKASSASTWTAAASSSTGPAPRMLGFEPAEVLGRNMHELTHHSHADGAHYPEHRLPDLQRLSQGLPCRIDTEVFWRRDGSAFAGRVFQLPHRGRRRRCAARWSPLSTSPSASAPPRRCSKAKDELEQRVSERTRGAVRGAGAAARTGGLLRNGARGRAHPHRARGARRARQPAGGAEDGRQLAGQAPGRAAAARTPRRPRTCATRMRCKCQNMSRLIETAVDNVGRIITDLRPSILDHQGLWAALEWQAHEFVQSAELALDWHMDVAGRRRSCPSPGHGGVPHLPGDAQQRGAPCAGQPLSRSASRSRTGG